MSSTRAARAVVVAVMLACVFSLAVNYTAANLGGYGVPAERSIPLPPNGTVGVEEQINHSNVNTSSVTGGNHITVVATQGFYVSDEAAELVAFDAEGGIIYHDDTYRIYFDVDPVPGERYTVEYVAAKHLSGEDCAGFEPFHCTRNVVERVNLSTGKRARMYDELTPRVYSERWHDVDRVNGTHLAVADIVHDRVYVVNTRTDVIA